MKVNVKKAFNKKKVAVIILLIAAVAVMIASNPEIKEFFSKTDAVRLNFQTGVEYDMLAYGKEMLLVNNEGICSIDKSGREVWSAVSTTTSPYVQTEGKYILLADINGKEINIFKKEKLVSQIATENEILSAKVNKNGYIAVATDELGYKGMIILYNRGGKELFRWHSGNGYIGDIAISPSNKLAIAQLVTDKEEICSKILLINPNSNSEPKCIAELKGIATKLKFNDDGSVVTLTDKGLYGFKRSGKPKFEVDFGSRRLLKCNIENKNNMVLAFDSGRSSTVLESYSSKGKLRGSFDAGDEVRTIDVSGECIMAANHDKLIKLAPNGTVKKEFKASKDVKAIRVFKDRSKLLSLGDSSAELINIR